MSLWGGIFWTVCDMIRVYMQKIMRMRIHFHICVRAILLLLRNYWSSCMCSQSLLETFVSCTYIHTHQYTRAYLHQHPHSHTNAHVRPPPCVHIHIHMHVLYTHAQPVRGGIEGWASRLIKTGFESASTQRKQQIIALANSASPITRVAISFQGRRVCCGSTQRFSNKKCFRQNWFFFGLLDL